MSTQTTDLRIGMVGYAFMGTAHSQAWRTVNRVFDLPAQARMTAICGRDPVKVAEAAATLGWQEHTTDWRSLIARDDIDLIDVCTPGDSHAEIAIAALSAGKHVLCEKPFAANAQEAEQMVRVAEETGLLLVEAFHYRYHPLFERVLSIVQSGQLGTIRHMEGVFKVAIKDKTDLRHRFDTAGGATMDLGCYPLHWMRTVAGTEPRVLSARAEQGEPDVDVVMQAELAFPGGITAHMLTSMADHEKFNTSLRVEGQNGTLLVQNPLAPHNGHELRLQRGGEDHLEKVEGQGSTYWYQLRAFTDAVRTGKKLPTMGADSVHNMRLIDAVYRAAGLPVRGTAR